MTALGMAPRNGPKKWNDIRAADNDRNKQGIGELANRHKNEGSDPDEGSIDQGAVDKSQKYVVGIPKHIEESVREAWCKKVHRSIF